MTILESGPFKGLPAKHFKVILADPPWTYLTRSDKGRERSPEYNVMSLDDIKALPVKQLAAKDCVLFMWIIDSHLALAMDVVKAWGFTYKTVGFYWEKLNQDGSPFTGMGFWTRANPEQCWYGLDTESEEPGHQWLLSTTGNPKRIGKDVPRLIRSPRREHSRKPDELFPRIERLCPGPYVELFSRESRPGWSHWGDEAGRFDGPSPSEDAIWNETVQALIGDPPKVTRRSRLPADLAALI